MEIAADSLRRFATATRKRRTLLFVVAIASATVIAVGVAITLDNRTGGDYITNKVDRGSVDVMVSATGTLQPVKTVEVGSQASGTVSWLGADFKSQVKRGQIIAKLDPAMFQAQVENQQAALANASAAVKAAETDINDQDSNLIATKANQDAADVARDDAMDLLRRDQDLRDVVAGRDIEAAKAAADAAEARDQQAAAQVSQAQAALAGAKAKLDEFKAAVAQAQAELDQAKVNLDHTIITSPIDGVVVSRNVDVGQTVAASLQAPILFVIANDLSNMQVLASVDEADVSQIHEGVTANFTVDAYPGETFSGRISQIRLNAQEQQNVVTYSAVIDVSNPDQKLMPGMTANIAVLAAHAEDVLTVPNAALRFKPDQPDQIIASAGHPQADTQGQSSGQASAEGRGASVDDGQRLQDRTLWVLNANKKLEPRSVTAGITNGRVTAITGGDLNQGDAVVLGQI